MTWKTISGEVYEIPTSSNFNSDSVLLHSPGIAIIYLYENKGYPKNPRDSIMSVPHHRFDEVQEVVNNGDILYKNINLDVYQIGKYLTYPYEIDSMIYGDDTYLYTSDTESFVFRRVNKDIGDSFTDKNHHVDNTVLIERFDDTMSIVNEELLLKYIQLENIYQLIPLDKEARGLYKDTIKDPYWD